MSPTSTRSRIEGTPVNFLAEGLQGYTVNTQKLEAGLVTFSAGIPSTLLCRIEATGFPTFGLLLSCVERMQVYSLCIGIYSVRTCFKGLVLCV